MLEFLRVIALTENIRCAECGREVDEFTAIAEKWCHRSDGGGELVPFCPECAKREFAAPEASTNDGLDDS